MPNGEAAEAVADHIQRVLFITRAALGKDIENTLVHEAVHCISEQMALYLPEDAVIKLANGLEAFMRDNPDLLSAARPC
jgi:hypothetical protein